MNRYLIPSSVGILAGRTGLLNQGWIGAALAGALVMALFGAVDRNRACAIREASSSGYSWC